jgi:hypothetical protein
MKNPGQAESDSYLIKEDPYYLETGNEVSLFEAASVYLVLLADTFSNSISYEQCRRLAADLPEAVLNLVFSRRPGTSNSCTG